jgi:hypothetical protein
MPTERGKLNKHCRMESNKRKYLTKKNFEHYIKVFL